MKPVGPLSLLVVALANFQCGVLRADEQPSVLVQTMNPTRGSLPDIVVAFGTAVPALDGSTTISVQSQGRVRRFLVTTGEAITAGQPLIDFSLSQSALGSFRQAETALATAKIDRVRIEQLRKQQLATKDQVTQADKTIADAQTALDTLIRSDSNKANLTINAPFDGVVSAIPIAQGDTVAPGATIMTLMRNDGLVITAGVEPSQRLRMKPGDPATITPLTSGSAPMPGRVARIDGLLNPKTHLIDTDVTTKARLLAGAAFQTAITVGTFEGFIVPRDAVLTDAKGAYCFQVAGDTAKRVDVRIIGSTGERSAVDGPIDPAEPLVISGNYQLADGLKVRFGANPQPTASSEP